MILYISFIGRFLDLEQGARNLTQDARSPLKFTGPEFSVYPGNKASKSIHPARIRAYMHVKGCIS